eukprot:scaffold4760_cov113-Isochrysis_galbana.AAC.7
MPGCHASPPSSDNEAELHSRVAFAAQSRVGHASSPSPGDSILDGLDAQPLPPFGAALYSRKSSSACGDERRRCRSC